MPFDLDIEVETLALEDHEIDGLRADALYVDHMFYNSICSHKHAVQIKPIMEYSYYSVDCYNGHVYASTIKVILILLTYVLTGACTKRLTTTLRISASKIFSARPNCHSFCYILCHSVTFYTQSPCHTPLNLHYRHTLPPSQKTYAIVSTPPPPWKSLVCTTLWVTKRQSQADYSYPMRSSCQQ